MALALLSACAKPAAQNRQVAVERRSEQVMPFSMSATMHTFIPTSAGGVQSVMVHNDNADQIALVRQHLRKEASAFSHGDFSDPAYIHGTNMPGIAEMEHDYSKMSVTYSDIPNGARLVYYTTDPRLVQAVHAWFKAQVSDHGSHATM